MPYFVARNHVDVSTPNVFWILHPQLIKTLLDVQREVKVRIHLSSSQIRAMHIT